MSRHFLFEKNITCRSDQFQIADYKVLLFIALYYVVKNNFTSPFKYKIISFAPSLLSP